MRRRRSYKFFSLDDSEGGFGDAGFVAITSTETARELEILSYTTVLVVAGLVEGVQAILAVG